MPIFEYVCKRCKNQFEELVFGQDEVAVCPSCGSTKTQKLMSRCRSKAGGGPGGADEAPSAKAAPARSGGGCAGCSGGSCSTCG
jgi:putative FmdB family regulatory protein